MNKLPRRSRTKLFIVVNPVGSKFAKALQESLRSRGIGPVLRTNRIREGRSCFVVTQQTLNKVQQFERFQQSKISCPRFVLNANEIDNHDVKTWFARTLINSTNGRGIVEFDREVGATYPAAPLYTEYIPKKAEYRFHVFAGEVIDVQQKRKKRGFEGDRDHRVRNLLNGYVYCRDGINPPDGAADLAINAVKALGYSYGAVDLIYNEKRNQCFVLEVNSRPGLMGTTLDKYTAAIINMFNLEKK